MTKEESKVNMTAEKLGNITNALFQIVALAEILQLSNTEIEPSGHNKVCDVRLSFAEIIAEKAELCLEKIGVL